MIKATDGRGLFPACLSREGINKTNDRKQYKYKHRK